MGGVLVTTALAIAGVAIWASQEPPEDEISMPAAPSTTPPPVSPPAAARSLDYDAIRKQAQTTLRAALRETEAAVRVQGSDALGKIKDQPSVPALTELTERDPDPEVRGHAADALSAIGAPAAQLLARLEADAPPPLKVWYASALVRLGDQAARKRLLAYASDTNLAVSFKAGLALADVSRTGDKSAIAALRVLAAQEAELNHFAPYAGALILTKLAALRDASARKRLHELLESRDEGARLAAAEGLARLGDDAGRKVLQEVLASSASPNQLVAAVVLISLGEYAGVDLITAKLDDRDPEIRRIAARALGEIGERESLEALLRLAGDKDWMLRIAASAAIVGIVGIDPLVLARASVDWTKGALDSQDWVTRKAAAGVLADIPERDALPLLARAIGDPDPNVRLIAAKSAGKMKGPGAATELAAAAKAEADPSVKEQLIQALGEIGSPAARDTLAQLSQESGRISVIAAGSLIAIGDASGKAKLEAAISAPRVELRLAAVQAASMARSPLAVPTLKLGAADRVFDVRFTAAEGLAALNAERAVAVPVLTAALASKDAGVRGRAVAALIELGEEIGDKARAPVEMLDSMDPKLRLAAVPIVRALPPGEGVPLLRRLVADPDQDVRRAGVDAIEVVAAKAKDHAIKLYKPLVHDADPVVRSKASGQLARLVPPPPPVSQTASATPAPSSDPAPGADDALSKIQVAAGEAAASAASAKQTAEAFEALVTEIRTTIGSSPRDDAAIQRLEDLTEQLEVIATKLEAAATEVESAAKVVADAAGATPSPEGAKLVADAKVLAEGARGAATTARVRVPETVKQARRWITAWLGDPQIFIAAAEAAIATSNFAGAKQNLDKATRLIRRSGARNASLDFAYAQLHDKMAARTQDPSAKRKLLQEAAAAYQQFARSGTGPRVKRANDRTAEIADELKLLGQP